MAVIERGMTNHFSLPERIDRLGELAYNLWWVWSPEARAMFLHIDPYLWEEVNHNPVALLKHCDRARLNAFASEINALDLYDRVMFKFDAYMAAQDTWFHNNYRDLLGKSIAYFSFEFGLHESLPVYAGGLGILSGDHLKESSDLGIPLVGIGFIYHQGYFMQHITEDGWQNTANYALVLDEMPLIPLVDQSDQPLMISVDLPGRKVFARIWEVRVGRRSLFLLDSDVDANSPNDRQLTARLYSSDLDVRISQEILLGIGGVKTLELLGLEPTVWHMNEGHSAFLTIERIRAAMQKGMTYQEASEKVARTDVFTTHTPVPAGLDQFPVWMIDKYLSQTWQDLNLSREQFIELGKYQQAWGGDNFSMPVMALRLSDQRNAVSELHGIVSRKMWNFLWPDTAEEKVPITHVTNGVHVLSWMCSRLRTLFDRHFSEDWIYHIDDPAMWQAINEIPDDELWEAHQFLKDDLIRFATRRARKLWVTGRYHPVQIIAAGALLNSEALTIGVARRFATYKRSYLILQDFERVLRLVNNPEMPLQIIFAGKAHPADEPGKLIIQQVYRAAKDARMAGRLVFLEDYDMNIARHMVQGVDVWLNTPRPPNEASGTSGMKAAMNGVMNFSVRDGWWREAYNGENGWNIGVQKEYQDAGEEDNADAASLYETLESEILPLYYKNRRGNLPSRDWIRRMKESIRTLAPQFSTTRMLKEYMQDLYVPGMRDRK
jgi:glycogen phosphorylase